MGGHTFERKAITSVRGVGVFLRVSLFSGDYGIPFAGTVNVSVE